MKLHDHLHISTKVDNMLCGRGDRIVAYNHLILFPFMADDNT